MAILVSSSSFAQLTERINNPGKIKTGTRPVKGNMGMFLAISSADVRTLLDTTAATKVESILPLGCIKYYISDDLVFRVGVYGKKTKTSRNGEIDPNVNGIGGLTSKKEIGSKSEWFIKPAIEKHFLNSNVLDPYIVATLPIGYLKERNIDNETYAFGDFYNSTVSKFTFAYGIETHLGLQAFVADLPMAIGLELGFTGLGYLGEKFKHTENNRIGGIETTQEYYTYKGDPLNTRYSSLRSNSFDGSGSIRLTLSYYFNK